MGSDEVVKYEPAVIQEHAGRLYKMAARLVVTWAIRFFVLGGVVGLGLFSMGSAKGGGGIGASLLPGFIVGLVAALLGAAYGREKGFQLRLTAQLALCQLQIEINSRKA